MPFAPVFVRRAASRTLRRFAAQAQAVRAEQAAPAEFCRTYVLSPEARIRSCRPQDTLHEVSVLMRDSHVGSLLVTDDADRVVGIITERDFVKAAKENSELHIETALAGDYMTKANILETVKETCGVKTIMHKMLQFNVRHMPVVDKKNRIIKMISVKDVQCSLVRQLEAALDCITHEPNTASRVILSGENILTGEDSHWVQHLKK